MLGIQNTTVQEEHSCGAGRARETRPGPHPEVGAHPCQGMAQWKRYDYGARALRTTGRHGPEWSEVHYRSTRDLDTGEYLEDRVPVRGLRGRSCTPSRTGPGTWRPPSTTTSGVPAQVQGALRTSTR